MYTYTAVNDGYDVYRDGQRVGYVMRAWKSVGGWCWAARHADGTEVNRGHGYPTRQAAARQCKAAA